MGNSIRKLGKAISRSGQVLSPVTGTLVRKGLEKANMRPDDPLNLAPRMGGDIPDRPETATERYLRQRVLVNRRGG